MLIVETAQEIGSRFLAIAEEFRAMKEECEKMKAELKKAERQAGRKGPLFSAPIGDMFGVTWFVDGTGFTVRESGRHTQQGREQVDRIDQEELVGPG